MALHWDFTAPAGTITLTQYGDTFTLNLYQGNATLIAVHEFTDEHGTELYNVCWFFLDDSHAKRCLGLTKGADGTKHNMFGDGAVHDMKLYRDNCNWKTLADLFSKAFPDITITITKAPEA